MARGRSGCESLRRAHRGQAMVEMALVLPIFLLVLFGLIDVGRLVFTNSMLSQAAREGARVAAVQARWMGMTSANDAGCVAAASAITATNPGAHVCPPSFAALNVNVQTAANSELVGVGAIPIGNVLLSCDLTPKTTPWTTTSCVNNSTGDLVSVRLQLTYQPITPIVGSFFGSIIGPINLVGAATMVIN
jgi:Flp pilus assembly protein TadG